MEPIRIYAFDGEVDEGHRRLAIVRPPIDFTTERLKRVLRRAKDTRDPHPGAA